MTSNESIYIYIYIRRKEDKDSECRSRNTSYLILIFVFHVTGHDAKMLAHLLKYQSSVIMYYIGFALGFFWMTRIKYPESVVA